MTAIIQVPGVLTPAPGMERALILFGSTPFLEKGLEALYLLADGAGTAVADELEGADGLIEHIDTTNIATSWMADGEGGGLRLAGAKFASFPAFEAADPWSFFVYHRTIGGVGSGEKIVGLAGFREFAQAASKRGSYFYSRGTTDLSAPVATSYYEHRPVNGSGAAGTTNLLLPTNVNVVEAGRLAVHSFNGTDVIRTTIYDKNANVIATDDLAVTEAQLFTISAVTDSILQPIIGGANGTFAGGNTIFEAFARYDRYIEDFTVAEIAQMCAAGDTIGTARDRPW